MVVINNSLVFSSYIPSYPSLSNSLSDLDYLESAIEKSPLNSLSNLENLKTIAESEEASLLLMMIMIILQSIDTRSAFHKALKSGSVLEWVHFVAKLGVFMSFVMIPLCELLGGACTFYAYGLDSYHSLCLLHKKQRKSPRDSILILYYISSNIASASGGMKHVFIVLTKFV